MKAHGQLGPNRGTCVIGRVWSLQSHSTEIYETAEKGVRHRCRNGPEGASHNGA